MASDDPLTRPFDLYAVMEHLERVVGHLEAGVGVFVVAAAHVSPEAALIAEA